MCQLSKRGSLFSIDKQERGIAVSIMKFISKKDLWLGVFLWVSMIGGLFLTIKSKHLLASLVMVLSTILVASIWFGTWYTIASGVLKVRCGPFCKNIKIQDIKSVKNSKNPLSSAALSLHRLKIRYGKTGFILVSPKERKEFIKALKRENRAIYSDEGQRIL